MSTSSEIILACNRSPAETCKELGAAAKELAPVHFGQSHRLWQLELAIYIATLCFAGLAIFPFLFSAWYWPIALSALALFIGWQLCRCWRNYHSSARILHCTQNRWYLRDQGGEQEVSLCDEVLFWSHIIVLPVRGVAGVKNYLVLTPDAMDANDWRRLRVWLQFFCR